MNPLIFTNPFASLHIGVKECFCGKTTIEDHDFCFCSPECARADSLRALGGQGFSPLIYCHSRLTYRDQGDCHYRDVMQRAYANSATPAHGLLRHNSAHQLRSASTSRHISVSQHDMLHPNRMKPLPAIPESRNESVDAQQSPLPQRTLKRSLQSKAGLNKSIRNSIVALFRNKQGSNPDATIRREPSVTGAILQEEEEEEEEEVALQRRLNHTEDRSKSPTLIHHQVRQTTATQQSRIVRRSASFAGLDNGKRGSVMEAVFQLRQAWNETEDFMPDFDERSDDEDY
ncbi:uncharacterized protein EDB93DRAFT_921782 [Suillus bovinus]|uniref:uncharacterized protein n=1 Tax=Suillus bovinus TaxID=48563 RepID=UPI001B87D530|nr:uncharacterized protein EDB93DRAFT_921782 [Suillus bovinus]KAG2156597.1 hypothetical protein EDB93DRAFT_921782 [Suillus bovinus]